MRETFDVRLGDLTGAAAEPDSGGGVLASPAPDARTFYIETFGCQMNDHDSEKVAGVLLGRGYRQMASVDAAKLVLYNTCSIDRKSVV
jgi:hypothetical protein